jgi:hypothetical protein
MLPSGSCPKVQLWTAARPEGWNLGTLGITELALVTHGSTLAKKPALRTQTVEIENEPAMWAPFTTGAQLVKIVADVPCRVVFGGDPEPTLDDSYLPANTPPLMTMNPAPAEHDGRAVVILHAVWHLVLFRW